MAEINSSPGSLNSKKLSTRVDLTPMVDLGFLLLTFFVFTTTMNQPAVMNMNETKAGVFRPVPGSGAMTILLGENHKVYYYYGDLNAAAGLEQFRETNFQGIRNLILEKKREVPLHKLMYIIKSNKDATFKDAIDILDEMVINNVPPGHYAEEDLSNTEDQLMGRINKP